MVELLMAKWGLPIWLCVACAVAVACDVTSPSPPQWNLAGEWIGSVGSRGNTPMRFTVSPDQRITSITIEAALDRCTVTADLINLQLAIETHYPESRSELAGFRYRSGPPDLLEISGEFRTKSDANGSVSFFNYHGCGSGGGNWRAIRR